MKDYILSDTQIELRNLTFYAYHGVLPEERSQGNTFVVDLTLDADVRRAVYTDALVESVWFFVLPLIMIALAQLSYWLGTREIKIFGFISSSKASGKDKK